MYSFDIDGGSDKDILDGVENNDDYGSDCELEKFNRPTHSDFDQTVVETTTEVARVRDLIEKLWVLPATIA